MERAAPILEKYRADFHSERGADCESFQIRFAGWDFVAVCSVSRVRQQKGE